MKIGITMYSFHRTFKEGKMDIEQFIAHCGKEGFDSLDLVAYFWKDRAKEEPKIQGWMKKTKVKLLTYAVGNNMLPDDPKQLDAEIEKVRDGIKTAAKLGAPYVRVFGGSNIAGFTSASALDHVIEQFKKLMPMCKDHGVTLAIENHGGWPGTAAELRMVVEGVDNEHFTGLFDTGNWIRTDEDAVKAAKELKGIVGLVHVKDMCRLPANTKDPAAMFEERSKFKVKPAAMGEGDVHLPEVIKALKASGFGGYATIEAEWPGDEFANASTALAYMRKMVGAL